MADDKNAAPEVSEGKKANNPLLTITLLVNAGLMGVVGFLQYKIFNKDKDVPNIREVVRAEMENLKPSDEKKGETSDDVAKEVALDLEQDGFIFNLDPFTANLAPTDGQRRFVRVNVVLRVSKEGKEEELKARKPQIRDLIIGLLNSKRADDLLKLEGKNILKEEIKSSINSFLIDGHVADVYYVGFQIN